MDALETMISRNSVPARLLNEPAPEGAELQEILDCAMRAPDHGALRPWRFLVIRGESRQRLGEVFAEALCRRDPLADAEARQKEMGRPMRSPLIIAVCAKIVDDHPKVPPVEQIVACGAAAQNVMNAAHAKGYAGIMLTGANAHDPVGQTGAWARTPRRDHRISLFRHPGCRTAPQEKAARGGIHLGMDRGG